MESTCTKAEVTAGLKALMTVADVIKESGQIPAGRLYAALMTHGCTLTTFESLVGLLTRGESAIVERRGDLLIWKGWANEPV